MASLTKTAEHFFERYEGRISSFFLIAGFIFDNLTLQRIDQVFDHIIIVSYLLIAGGSITLLNYYKERKPTKSFIIWIRDILPFLIQFTLGGLFSVFLVFYARSAAILSSWPFLVFLLFLLIGNEFFRGYYHRLTFQIAIYYIAIFSFSIIIIPVLLKTISTAVFLLSGIVSLILIYFFVRALFRVVPKRFSTSRTNLRNAVLAVFVVINILYFTNLIPPIPLAMKSSGVYYSLTKEGDNYRATEEKQKWYESLPFIFPIVIHPQADAPLYAFSSVFAPTDLNTKVIHDWQYFDEKTGKWVSSLRVTFTIFGGRGEGYRTFSKKENIFAGKWRVDVETERGQIIGRVRFNVDTTAFPVVLEEKIL